jgi:hypothetical protein
MTNFEDNFGITKYMWIFYYLMCPKTKQAHLNLYKSNNIPIPEYLDENKLMNYIDIINKDELTKLIKNINKKYINQKYLEFINKVQNIENFNINNNYINIILIIIIIIIIIIILLIVIYDKSRRFF